MQYQVPQFIEIEDKIFGQLTLKQFLYVAGGFAAGFIIWSFLPKWLAILIGAPILGFCLSLAFLKVNGRPFVETVESAIKYFFQIKLYIWHKAEKKPSAKKEEDDVVKQLNMPKMSDSKLKDITWSLDINKKVGTSQEKIGNNLIR